MSPQGLLSLLASLLLFGGGLVHSILGERRFRTWFSDSIERTTPYSGVRSRMHVIRVVWHLVTIAAWTASALFFVMAQGPIASATVSSILGAAFLMAGIVTLLFSPKRPVGWVSLFVISGIAFYEATTLSIVGS